MPDCHVHIGAASDPRRDVVNEEVQVFIHTGLQTEGPDDAGCIVLLRRFDVLLRQPESLLQERLAQGCRIVAADRVLRVDLAFVQRQLLRGRKTAVTVQAGLKAPVYADELDAFCDGRVEIVQIEDRPDDVALNPGQLNSILVDHILAKQQVCFLAVLLIGGGSEKSPL